MVISGADAVAHFKEGKAVEEISEYTNQWKGATWQFKSAENREVFAKSPERYAPQFGGYFAWAVSQGYTASIAPKAWFIVNGKLYLEFSKN